MLVTFPDSHVGRRVVAFPDSHVGRGVVVFPDPHVGRGVRLLVTFPDPQYRQVLRVWERDYEIAHWS